MFLQCIVLQLSCCKGICGDFQAGVGVVLLDGVSSWLLGVGVPGVDGLGLDRRA